jgi:hypothetical protein
MEGGGGRGKIGITYNMNTYLQVGEWGGGGEEGEHNTGTNIVSVRQ